MLGEKVAHLRLQGRLQHLLRSLPRDRIQEAAEVVGRRKSKHFSRFLPILWLNRFPFRSLAQGLSLCPRWAADEVTNHQQDTRLFGSFRVLCGSGYKLAVRRRWRESLSRVDQRGCRRGIFEGMAQVSKAIPAKKRTAAGEVTPPAAGCTLAHPRPGYPSLGCVPAEPNSVSPDGMSLAQYAYRINVHLATCAMPPKILRRQPHLASGLTATHRKPGRTGTCFHWWSV